MADTTPQDLENARVRREIADRQDAEWREAEALAAEALGPGWKPWMKLVLIDGEYHRTGDNTPVAVAYKVWRGDTQTTANSMFVRRMPDGTVLAATGYEPLFGELLTQPHPTRTFEIRGETVAVPRWSLCWSALELYEPKTAEQLAAAREKREHKAVEKEAADSPLFAELIRAEGFVPKRRR